MAWLSEFKRFLRSPFDLLKLLFGFGVYFFKGRTPAFAYSSMIRLFCVTRGYSNDLFSWIVRFKHPSLPIKNPKGVLGDLDDTNLSDILGDLKENGYYVFKNRLSDALCDELLRFATTTPFEIRPEELAAAERPERTVAVYDRANPKSVRYDCPADVLTSNSIIQQLYADPTLLAIAQGYLGSAPILDFGALWWHTTYSDKPSKEAAQFFHFDMDRLKWLKFFVYITDVEKENGPHTFVAGSQKTNCIPRPLLKQGYARLDDEDVERFYPKEKFIEFTGRRGTIIAEDTRGLHKGKHVEKGDRLVLSIQFSNSQFGINVKKTKISGFLNQDFARLYEHRPELFPNLEAQLHCL
jgi:ectoine hydroxylase-related dioxygenase (phytanoyl-CoA dioxygenase family)